MNVVNQYGAREKLNDFAEVAALSRDLQVFRQISATGS